MNRTTYMITEGQNYYNANKRKIWILGVSILAILLILSVGFITKTVTAKSSINKAKLVTSVEVQEGDTLWSIASNYISEEYSDMNDYIKEIKATNQISDNEIYKGSYIIVPYYPKESSDKDGDASIVISETR